MLTDVLRTWPELRGQALRFAWREEFIRTPVLVFLILRLLTGIAILIMVRIEPAPPPSWLDHNPSGQTYFQAMPTGSPLASIVEPWHRWDTAWYVKIAIQGYHPDDPSFVFPPLYPVLIRLLTPFTFGNYVLSALLISSLACLAALILLFKLVEMEFGSAKLARYAVICLAAFPTSYYLMAGYTESLFLALALGAFVAALKRHWWLAGILAFFASLARLQGAVLCLPLAWIAYVQLRESGWKAVLMRLPAALGGGLGTAAYFGYVAINHLGSFGDAYAQEWQLYTRSPLVAIQEFFTRLHNGWTVGFEMNNAYILVFIGLLALIVTFRMRPAYALYTWSTLLLILVRYHGAPPGYSVPQFESMVRYALLIFPCFIALAMILSRWWLLMPYVIGATYWQWFLLNDFTHWRWVA